MDDLMKKTMNPEESALAKLRQGGGDVVVPRDFMIKTAYVKKRRGAAADTQSVRSRQPSNSGANVFVKNSTNTV